MTEDTEKLVESLLLSGEAKLLHDRDDYAVTKSGRVFSRRKHTFNRWPGAWREKSYNVGAGGYIFTFIRPKSIGVHRLIASAFLGERPNGHHVRHLDGNKLNNHLPNIAYGTPTQNKQDSIKHGTWARGSKCHTAKLTEWNVRVVREMFASGYPRFSIAKKFNVHRDLIGNIVRGKTWAWLDKQTT